MHWQTHKHLFLISNALDKSSLSLAFHLNIILFQGCAMTAVYKAGPFLARVIILDNYQRRHTSAEPVEHIWWRFSWYLLPNVKNTVSVASCDPRGSGGWISGPMLSLKYGFLSLFRYYSIQTASKSHLEAAAETKKPQNICMIHLQCILCLNGIRKLVFLRTWRMVIFFYKPLFLYICFFIELLPLEPMMLRGKVR